MKIFSISKFQWTIDFRYLSHVFCKCVYVLRIKFITATTDIPFVWAEEIDIKAEQIDFCCCFFQFKNPQTHTGIRNVWCRFYYPILQSIDSIFAQPNWRRCCVTVCLPILTYTRISIVFMGFCLGFYKMWTFFKVRHFVPPKMYHLHYPFRATQYTTHSVRYQLKK